MPGSMLEALGMPYRTPGSHSRSVIYASAYSERQECDARNRYSCSGHGVSDDAGVGMLSMRSEDIRNRGHACPIVSACRI